MLRHGTEPRGIVPAVVAIIVAAAAGTVAAVMGAGPWSAVARHPQVALDRAWVQAVEAVSVRTRADVRIAWEQDEQSASLHLTYDGRRGEHDGARASDGTITAAGAIGDATLGFLLDTRAIGEMQYLRLRDFSFLGGTSAPAVALGAGIVQGMLGERWVVADSATFARLQQRIGGAAAPSAPYDASRAAALREQARTHPLLMFQEDLGRERVDGVRARHLRTTINEQALAALIALLAGSESGETLAALLQTAVVPRVRDITIDVWLTGAGAFVRAQFPFAVREDATNIRLTGTADIQWSDWNVPVTMAPPPSALPLDDVIEQLFGVQPQPSHALPAGSDADADGLSDVREALYGSDLNSRDSDGDGYTDGEEVRNGYSPVGEGRL
ncbi:MAG: thrombospondin type 3 repeat-containing protein [bacterium]|nr:thrombospondin type 3 repeat-containing protein [bacterium]